MRSMLHTRARGAACLGALLALVLSGCSKKVTDPNSRPVPEGQQNGLMIMMGWHEQRSFWFTVVDPGTPDNPSDDVLGQAGLDFWADPAGVRTSTLDISQSNQLEAFRVGSDGNVQPMFDFLLEPTVRVIAPPFGVGVEHLDAYDSEDFSPPQDPAYFGRGALNGQITTASPVTNRAGAFSSLFDENMDWIPAPKKAAGDSVLEIRFGDDPRAAYYVVEIGGASGLLGTGDVYSLTRRLYGIPSPILPGTLPLSTATFLMPGGSGFAGLSFRLTSRRWPLFFYFRVTAIDAEGRLVNRVNDYLHVRSTESGNNFHTYEPLGGAVQVLDPYPDLTHPVNPPVVLTNDEAKALLLSFLGTATPNQVDKLGGSAASLAQAGSPPPALVDAMSQIAASPYLTKQASEQRFRAIRAKLGEPPSAPR